MSRSGRSRGFGRPVRPVGVDVERACRTLDDLFRDHDLFDALEAIAESALTRKIGARGLRMIIEDLMLDLMYSVPGQKKLREVVVTREIVEAKDKSITLIEKAG